MIQLALNFAYSEGQIHLERTVFRSSSDIEFIAVRGKTSGAYSCTGSFQWTPAVKAVCVLFIQALIHRFGQAHMTRPMISGRRGSLASSLDYAIDKEPQWLCDMFGLDESGKTNLRRLIFRSNPGGKRPGPVSITLNESALPLDNIQVFVDTMPVHDPEFLDSIIAKLIDGSPESINAPEVISFDSIILLTQTKRNDDLKRHMMIPETGEYDNEIPRIASVDDSNIEDIFQYEQQEFPGHHATKDRLQEWQNHDPSNFICIRAAGEPVMGYYILFFLKPESMKRFLAGELLKDDVRASDLTDPTINNYARQEDAHIGVFESTQQYSFFTVDLFWHLLGRIVYLAKFGRLSKIYAEPVTQEGQRILKLFNFEPAKNHNHNANRLFECKLTPEIIGQWEQCCARRSFIQPVTAPPPVLC
jgi:hypothetical protein